MKKSSNKNSKSKTRASSFIQFPARLIAPVGKFLKNKLVVLEKRKKDIEEEDPFTDTSRVIGNPSPDADAAEQFGHARTTAIKENIDRRIVQTKKALSRVKIGKYGICEDCSNMIDTDRLMVYPEATVCANCQKKREKKK